MPDFTHRRQFLVASAAILATAGAHAAQPVRTEWPRRKPEPSVTLWTLDGAGWTLEQERGHAVLLNFWASWCEPCLAEMPSLVRAAELHQARGLRVLAANYREAGDTVRHFLDAQGIALDTALDRDGSAAKAFGVHAFPSTVAIDRDGRVRFVVMGECDWTDARSGRWLDELLEHPG